MRKFPPIARPHALGRATTLVLVLAVLFRTGVAHAESTPSEHEQFVAFDDELLTADLTVPRGDLVFGAHLPPARTRLLRPRTTFVPELYQSVQDI